MRDAGLVSEQVFRQLLEAVLDGRYAPGEKLPGQRAMARDLGVTLGSLREALKRLEQMGLVEVRHGDAMRVNDWRLHGGPDVIAHLLFRAGQVDRAVLRDVLDARSLLMREIAGLAAERRTDEHAERLARIAADFAAAGDDPAATAYLDFAFYTELSRAADNVVFDLIGNAVRDVYLHNREQVPVTIDPVGLAEHYAEIADAVARGDVDAARDAMQTLAAAQQERVAGGRFAR
jgi:DNA-binding FadR family transcriptional regulator